MTRLLFLLYGLANYGCFLAAFLYLLAFVGGFAVPKTIDGEPVEAQAQAVAINLALVVIFGLQHSVMARPGFKRWWTRYVPRPIERSTYVLTTNLSLALLFSLWQPIEGIVWELQNPQARGLAWALFGTGWVTVLVTTFLIHHFDLLGLRQVWLYFRGRPCPELPFVMPGPYRMVRHPLYVGWLLAFWATPTMTLSHFTFSAALTAYILIAIRFEERDLINAHADYAEYRRQVPMLIPGFQLPRLRTGLRRTPGTDENLSTQLETQRQGASL